MELGSIFLVLAVLVVVGMYLYAPFMSRTRRMATNEMHEVSALKAELLDVQGRVLHQISEPFSTTGQRTLHMTPGTSLAAGIYVLRLTNGDLTRHFKLIRTNN